MSNNNANEKENGGFYARRPVEEIKAFKSKDGKYFVVQIIKTCVLPINYVGTILKNESPLANKGKTKTVSSKNKLSEC